MKRRRPNMHQAVHVGSLLEPLLKNLGLDERLQQSRAMIIWDEVVGPQIASHTKPIRIRDDVLEIYVDQPVWMNQLHLMKPQILRKLNSELGETPLKQIFLKRGKVTRKVQAARKSSLPWRTAVVKAEEKQHISALLTNIENTELKQQLETLLLKQLQLNKTANSS